LDPNGPGRISALVDGNAETGRTMKVVDREAVARAWAAWGFSCALWTDPPGQRWEGFRHAVDEVLMLIDGAIAMQIEGRILEPPGPRAPLRAQHRRDDRAVALRLWGANGGVDARTRAPRRSARTAARGSTTAEPDLVDASRDRCPVEFPRQPCYAT
jgi:hypothetical protein